MAGETPDEFFHQAMTTLPKKSPELNQQLSPTFALGGHFRPSRQKIPFAFNVGTAKSAKTGQVKTLPLF